MLIIPFHHQHVQGNGQVVEPLHDLLNESQACQNFWVSTTVAWRDICENALSILKLNLADPLLQYHLSLQDILTLTTDASDKFIGAVLES